MSRQGMGFFPMLFLLLLTLKLTHFIDWSWWVIIAPLWLPVFLLSFLGVLYIYLKEIIK